MISTIHNTRNVEFVVNFAIKLRLFYPWPNVYILQEMDIWFLLATTYFRNPMQFRDNFHPTECWGEKSGLIPSLLQRLQNFNITLS